MTGVSTSRIVFDSNVKIFNRLQCSRIFQLSSSIFSEFFHNFTAFPERRLLFSISVCYRSLRGERNGETFAFKFLLYVDFVAFFVVLVEFTDIVSTTTTYRIRLRRIVSDVGHETTFPPLRFKPRFSGVLPMFLCAEGRRCLAEGS